MKKLSIAIPVLGQFDYLEKSLDSFYLNAKYPSDIKLILIDNGSNPPIATWLPGFWLKHPYINISIFRYEENVGVTEALNKAFEVDQQNCPSDFIIYTHSDVLIEEKNWDEKLYKWLNQISDVGVVGLCGATGIGSSDIYKTPYIIWQLARFDTVSNMRDAEIHGRRIKNEIEPVVVLDGFCLITNTKLLKEVGGFDIINYPTHHNYDNDICLQAIQKGYHNFVLNIKCHHHGGITSTREDYANWTTKHGTSDAEIHAKAHVTMYEKYRGFLPVYIKSNKLYVVGNK